MDVGVRPAPKTGMRLKNRPTSTVGFDTASSLKARENMSEATSRVILRFVGK